MRFSEDFLEKILNATNIVDVISQHTELKRAGNSLSGLCPFPDHREKTPSFNVSDTKQVYHCFGCKRGGNAFRFLQDCQGMTFPESVEYLAQKAGIPLPVDPEIKKPTSGPKKEDLFKVNRMAGSFYHDRFMALAPLHPLRKYVQDRGLSSETIKQFKLGYSGSQWSDLADSLKSKRVPMPLAESLGLVKRRPDGSHFDVFRDRLMFPIFSPTGEVIGFGGRTLVNDSAKYINSQESAIFSKKRSLYGLHETAKYIRTEDQVVVVEGYMDFLALYQAGIVNVVAVLGTALTQDHARLLKRYTKNIAVLFDGDEAGEKAALRVLPILLAEQLLPKGIILPDGLDPDEFVQEHGAQVLKDRIRTAPDLFTLIADRVLQKFRATPTERIRVLDDLGPILQQVGDPRLKDLYIRDLADRMSVGVDWILKSLASANQGTKALGSAGARGPHSMITQGGMPGGGTSGSGMPGGSRAGTPVADHRQDSQSSPNSDQAPEITEFFKNMKTLPPGPKEEQMLLNLGLFREPFLKEIQATEIQPLMSRSQASGLLKIALEQYGQNQKNFDKLTAYLASRLDDSSLVTQHLDSRLFGFDDIEGGKLLKSCTRQIQKRHLMDRAQALKKEHGGNLDPQKLEQFMNILRDVRALEQGE